MLRQVAAEIEVGLPHFSGDLAHLRLGLSLVHDVVAAASVDDDVLDHRGGLHVVFADAEDHVLALLLVEDCSRFVVAGHASLLALERGLLFSSVLLNVRSELEVALVRSLLLCG